jgi:sugar-specific transcriptional regulator TrmB
MIAPKDLAEDQSLTEDLAGRLRELGVSSLAARALVSLLANSPQSAGSICKATGIPDSKVYYALEELDRARLVESQRGVPTLYRAVQFDQMISNLVRAEDEEHEHRLRNVERFRRRAEPYARARASPDEVELAYIVKGRSNIIERMLTAIEPSRKEVILLASSERLWSGLEHGLAQAKKRRVKVGIAVTSNLSHAKGLNAFGDLRRLNCECNIVIVDSEKLITASEFDEEEAYAIVTSDKSMIRMSREYFDNPDCCAKSH